MTKTTIWHNPRCSKSREALSIADENGVEVTIIKYLNESPSREELSETLKLLGFSTAREWMRTKEDIYKELNLQDIEDEEKLLEAMFQNPKLMERPVIIKGNKAIIGRPTSIIAEFLKA